jgi:hypothetical protein
MTVHENFERITKDPGELADIFGTELLNVPSWLYDNPKAGYQAIIEALDKYEENKGKSAKANKEKAKEIEAELADIFKADQPAEEKIRGVRNWAQSKLKTLHEAEV